jgi:hypothetical protein
MFSLTVILDRQSSQTILLLFRLPIDKLTFPFVSPPPSLLSVLPVIVAYHLIVHARRRARLESQPSNNHLSSNDANPGGHHISSGSRPSKSERLERLKWTALAGRVAALGVFFLLNSILDGLAARLVVSSLFLPFRSWA